MVRAIFTSESHFYSKWVMKLEAGGAQHFASSMQVFTVYKCVGRNLIVGLISKADLISISVSIL